MTTARIVILLAVAVTWGNCCELAPKGGFPWNYQDTKAWASKYPNCGSTSEQQSPINLDAEECGDGSNQPRVEKNKKKWKVKVTNDGRSLQVMFDCYNQKASNGAHGPLTLFYSHPRIPSGSNAYDLTNFHFHWDESEHAFEGEKFPAEVHFKFKRRDHSSTPYQRAKSSEGAFVAVGIPLVDEDADDLKFPTYGLEKQIRRVRKFNAYFKKTIKINPLKKLLNKAFEKVYKYIGSLTTPPCTLMLPWLVSEEPAKIKSKFLKELKKLRDENNDPILRNYRPLQKRTSKLDLCLHEGEGSEDNDVGKYGYHSQ